MRIGAWWIRRRKAIKLLLFINFLIWFWPLYLGHQTYKEMIVPQEISLASYQKPVVNYEQLPDGVKDTLQFYADLYGVDMKLVTKIVECESGGNPDRIGYEAKVPTNSFGLWQFQMGTWAEFSAKYKCRNCDIRDYRHQTLVAVQMLRDGYGKRWSCY